MQRDSRGSSPDQGARSDDTPGQPGLTSRRRVDQAPRGLGETCLTEDDLRPGWRPDPAARGGDAPRDIEVRMRARELLRHLEARGVRRRPCRGGAEAILRSLSSDLRHRSPAPRQSVRSISAHESIAQASRVGVSCSAGAVGEENGMPAQVWRGGLELPAGRREEPMAHRQIPPPSARSPRTACMAATRGSGRS